MSVSLRNRRAVIGKLDVSVMELALKCRLQPAGLGVPKPGPLRYTDGFCLRLRRHTYLLVVRNQTGQRTQHNLPRSAFKP